MIAPLLLLFAAAPTPTPTPEAATIDIEILAARPVTSAASTEIIREDLARRALFTPEDVFRAVPNLLVGQHAGGGKADQLFLRGFDADHGTDVAVSVDGVPVNAVSHAHGQGYADIHFVIPEAIETIGVEKGLYRAEQGDFATAGSVDFRLRDRFERPFVTVGGGSFGTARAVAGLSRESERGSVLVAGETMRTDGPFRDPQALRRWNGLVRGRAALTPSTTATLTAMTYDGSWNASGQIPSRAVRDGRIDRFGSIDPTEGGASSRHGATAAIETLRGDDQQLSAQAFAYRYKLDLFSNFTFFLDDGVNGDGIEQVDDRWTYGGEARWRVARGAFFTTLGLSTREDQADVALHAQRERIRGDAKSHAFVRESRRSAFVETQVTPVDRVRFVLGLRGDLFSFDVADRIDGTRDLATQSLASPKASAVIAAVRGPNALVDLFLNGGTGYHSNDARDVVRGTGTRTLPRAISTETGARARLRGVDVAASVWQLDLERELVWVGDAGETDLRGSTRRRGVDVDLRVSPLPSLRLELDASYADARFRSTGDAVPLAPRVLASAGASWSPVPGFDAGIRVRHAGARPASEDGSAMATGQTVLDASLGWRRGTWALLGSIDNVTDAAYREAQFVFESRLASESAPVEDVHFTPGAPRSVRLTVTRAF